MLEGKIVMLYIDCSFVIVRTICTIKKNLSFQIEYSSELRLP